MGWTTFKIAACSAVVLSAGGLLGVPVAHADEQSYFDRLNDENLGRYITTEQALDMGNWYCQQLRNGRSPQAAYSDLLDYNLQQGLLPGYGQVGTLYGAAVNQLCRDQKYRLNGEDDATYLPVGQR
ncbi:DUF732 domain-containing protein [Mycolicibacterium arenosum]|uniref:DUF732 domain-containing protein n=1 Tax=Mycolicibacterium arenosum TaxID=2952157 RepID=A0ABT1M0U1_9MYCO|nr:DUF732 domain-containing protein [Mycolicibacterium sp. CAU 1645]MCP9272769.1 DUF732 domain-containing protein [Mycolicibacterium sp. CAU 1645]